MNHHITKQVKPSQERRRERRAEPRAAEEAANASNFSTSSTGEEVDENPEPTNANETVKERSGAGKVVEEATFDHYCE